MLYSLNLHIILISNSIYTFYIPFDWYYYICIQNSGCPENIYSQVFNYHNWESTATYGHS